MGFGRNARRRHAVVHACETLGDTAPFYLGRVPHCAGRGQRTSVGRMGRILHAQTLDVRGRQIRACLRIGDARSNDHDRDFARACIECVRGAAAHCVRRSI